MPYNYITLTARKELENRDAILTQVQDVVKATGANITDAQSGKADLHIVIGGDGTILATVRELQDFSAPLLCVHIGTLGFLSSVKMNEIEQVLPSLLAGEGVIDERQLLTICIEENGKKKEVGRVLNEATISQGGISRLMHLHTVIDGQELTTFRADGLIIATPTGSTAYSLAAGGTIIHPNASEHSTILTPINPHSFFQKPLIVPGNANISVEVRTHDNAHRTIEPVLTLDGQIAHPIQHGQKIYACAFNEHVNFLRTKDDNFYKKIREKLRWGE